MATVLSVKKQTLDESSVGSGGETEKQIYTVAFSDDTLTALAVQRTSGTIGGVTLPAYGSVHPSASTLYVTAKSAKRALGNDSRPVQGVWIVEVTYSNLTLGNTGGSGKNISISVTGVEQTIYTQESQDDSHTPIKNSLGDLYPDPIEVSIYDEQIEVSYETSTIDGNAIADLRGTINSGTVTLTIPQGLLSYSRSFDTHTLLMKSADYSVQISRTDNTTHIWSVKLILLYRSDTWDKDLPDKGYRWFASDGTTKTDYKESCEYLDGSGKKLAPMAELVTITPSVQVYSEADLAGFLTSI